VDTGYNPPMTDTELATLRAAMDRVYPRDDAPGATDLGTDQFLIRLLESEPQFRAPYEVGLAWLTERQFCDLEVGEQDRLLAEADPAFLGLLVQHTFEGAFADPGNGGNRGGAAWEMIGFRVTA
jgi:gluconate 2-dehydrogenase gamma chain